MKAVDLIHLLRLTRLRIRSLGGSVVREQELTIILDAHIEQILQFDPELEIEVPSVLVQILMDLYDGRG